MTAAPPTPGYLRWPALHGQALGFVADGSLWLQSGPGQAAQRLTERALQAREPAFSPCGRWLAYTALQGGAHELWVLDLRLGGARPLSAEALPLRVCGWHPDGRVLVAWRGLQRPLLWTLRLVDPHSAATDDLPLHDVSDACFTGPSRLVFVRGGLQDDHVQRYRGGAMRRLWTLDLAQDTEARPLPLPAAATAAEAWAPRCDGQRLFFLCDADGLARPWSAALDGSGAAPWLNPRAAWIDAPVDHLAVTAGRVVHARDGRLHAGPDAVTLDLPLPGDWPGRRRRRDTQPLQHLEAVRLHLQAGALLRCRGQLWWLPPSQAAEAATAGMQAGAAAGTVPLALPWPGGRAGAIAWSADGRRAYASSDATGTPALWQLAADAAPLQITEDGGADCSGLWPSPCGRWLLRADERLGLALLTLPAPGAAATPTLQPVLPPADAASLQSGPVTDAAWAADGQALVLARPLGPGQRLRLEHWRIAPAADDTEQGPLSFVGVVGDPAYPCFSPAWSACGRWLFYLCARHFESPDPHPWGDRNIGHGFPRRVRADAQAMADGAVWPWAPAAGADTPAGFAAPAAPVRAGDRRMLPLPADDHARLWVGPRGVLSWVVRPQTGAPAAGGLWRLDFGSGSTARWRPRAWQLVEAAGDCVLARPADDGKAAPLVWLQPGAGDDDPAHTAVAPGWTLPVDPPAEWAQHLRDAWRHRRERLFDARLHDAEGQRPLQRAQAALTRVTERSEVDALMARMLAGLGTLHSFVTPPPAASTADDGETAAFLGLQAEPAAGGLRITRVLRGSDTDPALQGPAAAAGLREGDLLLAVAGRPLAEQAGDPLALARALAGSAGRRLQLIVWRPDADRCSVSVQPHGVAAELALRHADHVRRVRERVGTASLGRIGYLHLSAMGQADLERFVRDAWADPGWRGLLLDLRGNRGGNIDSWLIEKLLRRPWAWWSRRHAPSAPNPPGSLPEPLAVLIDGHTYSDGETLAAGLQRLGRARLFGSRSSGAGIWLRQSPNLLDGGSVAVGEFGQFDATGWLIEGCGVEPDETVCSGPRAAAAGHDAALDRALHWLQQRIAEIPPPPPVPGADQFLARRSAAGHRPMTP